MKFVEINKLNFPLMRSSDVECEGKCVLWNVNWTMEKMNKIGKSELWMLKWIRLFIFLIILNELVLVWKLESNWDVGLSPHTQVGCLSTLV